MIKFIDFLSYSSSHVSFNSCVINFCRESNILLVGEQSHLENVTARVKKNIKTRNYKKCRLWKIKRDWFFFKEVFLVDKEEKTLILGATGTQLLILALFLYIFQSKSSQIKVIFHSELEFFDGRTGVNKFCAKVAVKYLNLASRIKSAVLSQHIKDNLLCESSAFESVSVVRHPMPMLENSNQGINPPLLNKHGRNLAVIGLLRGDTKDLALPGKIRQISGINVTAFGRRGPLYEKLELTEKCVLMDDHYSDSWLSEKLTGIDCLLLIPRSDSYKFTALGSVSDSISFLLPMVWKRHAALKEFESFPSATVFDDERSVSDATKILNSNLEFNTQRVYEWLEGWNKESEQEFNKFIL